MSEEVYEGHLEIGVGKYENSLVVITDADKPVKVHGVCVPDYWLGQRVRYIETDSLSGNPGKITDMDLI